jgi:NTP pyrophosphatase (non-canonical NTP hydrolase)
MEMTMRIDDYQQEAITYAIYDPVWSVIYPSMGLAGEAGEVLNKVKKVLRDNEGILTDEVKANIASELGDVMWYAANLAEDLGYDLSVILQENLEKLESRKERGKIGGSGDDR